MNSRVTIFTSLSGKRDVVIVDDAGLPVCFFLWSFISDCYGQKAFNTRNRYTHTINFIHKYFTKEKIDIVERVREGQLFSLDEVEKFVRHCQFNISSQQDKHNVVSIDKLINNPVYLRMHETRNSNNKVAVSTVSVRLFQFISYIDYLYTIFHYDNNSSEKISDSLSKLKSFIDERRGSLGDDKSAASDPYESAIPDKSYFDMLEYIKPSSSNNPWKGSRLRNQLIVQLLIETGIRKGAVAKLKITDIVDDWSAPRILVTRTPNDVTDARTIRPAQKTKPHASSISLELLKSLKIYISTIRPQYESDSHDFLFISEKGNTSGQPLALNSLSALIKVLSESIGFHFTPHILRHKWNEIFDIQAKGLGYSDQQIEDIRKYAMGWSENSEMSLLYNSMRNAIRVHEISSARSSKFMPKIDGEV